MLSQTKENYIKVIYHLHQKNEAISLSDIGDELGVSKPTVNNMIKKLMESGYVEYEKYKPIKISEKGKLFAAEIIRKHRLSEMFLSQVMSFGWEEVHEIAEELEHIRCGKFFDRMDVMLGHPVVDPHGSPIPNKDGEFNRKFYLSLSEAEVGCSYIIKALKNSSCDFLVFLNDKNIKLESLIKVIHLEEFDGNMTVSLEDNSKVVLSSVACAQLLVEKV